MPIFLAGKPALANGSTGVVLVGHGKLLFERESEGGRRREEEEEWAREGERGVQRASERAGGSLLVHSGKTRDPTASLST